MDILFFKASLVAYLISTLGYSASLLIQKVYLAKLSTWALLGAFSLHTLFFILRYLGGASVSVTGMYDSLSLFAWILCSIYLMLQLRTRTRVLGAFVSPVAFVMMIAASTGLEGPVTLTDTLRGGLVTAHVMLSVAGEALFALASCAGAMYLIHNRLIKSRSVSGFSRLLPPLTDLDKINHVCLLWGFPLLTLGILAGSVWARTVWGSHWQWDPKQVWTLTAWLLYALLLHQRLAIGWKGHKAALFSILALIFLVVAFAAEKIFFTTIHRFM
jgi:cytochrome c-type biogenesis protein CcsB